jgi:hypothetical protein
MEKPLRATSTRDDPEVDLRLPKHRLVGGDDDVAQHRQLASAALDHAVEQ